MTKHTTPDGYPVADYQISAPPHPSHHLRGYVPSEVWPHVKALQAAGIYGRLSEDDQGIIIKLMQAAYRNGQASQGAEKLDNDAVWLDGVGSLERQPDGTWRLVSVSEIAAALGRRGGSATSEAKRRASRENGKKGGRPRKHSGARHAAIEKLGRGLSVSQLTPEEQEAHRAYRRELEAARLAGVRAYQRARYRRIQEAMTEEEREAQRARWREGNRRKAERKKAKLEQMS
jgi:hypothetical protein